MPRGADGALEVVVELGELQLKLYSVLVRVLQVLTVGAITMPKTEMQWRTTPISAHIAERDVTK
jgi:hypothetical protein